MANIQKTAVAIGAHPDDIEIGCGGAELVLKQQGYRLIHIIVTDGGAGSLEQKPAELAVKRRKEALASANLIGADEVVFMDAADGFTSYSREMKIQLIGLLRRFQPDIVFTHAAQDRFPDHQLVHGLTIAAVTAAQGPWYEEAGGVPHHIKHVLGYEVWNPLNQFQYALDISPVMDQKLRALSQHRSQTHAVDYLGAVKGLAAYRGVMSMAGAYAEVFEVIKISEIFSL